MRQTETLRRDNATDGSEHLRRMWRVFFFFLSDKLSDGMALEDRFRIQREEDVAPTANMYRRMRPP